MNNLYQPEKLPEAETPIVTTKKSRGAKFMDKWHSIASPPEPPTNATVPQRERYRRARAVSTVILFFLPTMLLVFPTTIGMTNHWTSMICLFVAFCLIVALFLNRTGNIFIAGLAIVLSFQVGLMVYLLSQPVINETALQIYDLFTLVIILALAILPIRAIWFIALLDCVFVVLDLYYQPHTESFTHLIQQEQFLSLIVRPIAIILVLSCVASLLLVNVAKAVRQSYEAEFVANIEHAAAQQNEIEAKAKQELEESIQQIVQAHTDIMNGRSKERIPYPMAKVLWPLVGIQNTLWTRLQRLQQRDLEYSQLQEDMARYNETLQRSIQYPENPLMPYQTRTILAPISHSMANLHKELLNRLMGKTNRMRTDIF